MGPRLVIEFKAKLTSLVSGKLAAISSDPNYLGKMAAFWTELCSAMQTLRGIFNFLERTVLLKDDVTLWDLAL